MNPPWALDPDTDCMKDFIKVMHEQFSPEAFRKLYSNTIMNENEIKLSESQIHKMKHAIGFDISRVKRGKYTAFRNYYSCEDNAEWNELVYHGLARKRVDPFCKTDVIYHVTQDGMDYLSKLIGVKIVEDK